MGYRRREVDEAIEARDLALVRAGERVENLERVSTRLAECVVERDRALRALRDGLDWVNGECGRIAGVLAEAISALDAAEAAPEAVPDEPTTEPPSAVEPVPTESNGHGVAEPAALFEGLVEVEVGPLDDFAQLVGFEDAAGEIAATSEISVKRFTKGRATLSMRFREPVELLRELEERAPFEFRVRDLGSDRLILDVDE